LIPSIERIRLRPANVRRRSSKTGHVVGSKIYFDFRGAPAVPAHGASHGTLIVLALLAVLHGANRPNLVLLDDLDHALHPRAQIELMRMIKNLLALDEFKDVQVVATTHSPYVLDELDPSDVYAFALRDDGTVASKRLSEHPEAERTRGTLKSGQLWSLDPERDWVLRG
jgi:predicted ATPase